MPLPRSLSLVFLFAAWPWSAVVASAVGAEPPQPVSALLSRCLECHDKVGRAGGFVLESLDYDLSRPTTFDAWVKVHDELRRGEMPPPDAAQPAKAERDAAVGRLHADLMQADRSRQAASGRSVLRRLNRTEYENTLRDLFSLPGLKVRELLPEDGRAHGYDKAGTALELSHVQMAKYMEAADAALDLAIAVGPERPELYAERVYPGAQYDFKIGLLDGDAVFLKDGRYDDSVVPVVRERPKKTLRDFEQEKKFPYTGSVGVFRHEDDAFIPRFSTFAPVVSGRYRLRLSVWSFDWDRGKVLPAEKRHAAGFMAGGRSLGYFDAPSLKPTVYDVETWLDAGDHVTFNAATLWPLRVAEMRDRAAGYAGPGVVVDWLDVEGPLYDAWPPASHKRLFGELPFAELPKSSTVVPPRRVVVKQTRPGAYPRPMPPKSVWTVASSNPSRDAERLLSDFLTRAFRRPVPSDEVARYAAIVRARLEAGECFESAMRDAYRAALCSVDFLYLREAPGKLDDWALASRLSYFLWNSMPDDELFALAAQGKLRDGGVLRAQAERMLADPKAERFVADFLDQWLNLREIDFTNPDRRLYPEYRPYLHHSVLAESRAFFRELLADDLSATNVVDSDFAMLNQRLAEHYDLFDGDRPIVAGATIRKTKLPPNSGRGGLLTHASVLKVTANGTSTSPVKRGAWVMAKILGEPPAPPPPDVPAVEPDVRGATTIREQLAKHRSDPACAACHARIDPPGFALESYDVIGGLRDRYRATDQGDPVDSARLRRLVGARFVGYRLGLPVDPSGELADGRKFADLAELKRLLLADPARLADNLARQLAVYATGAPITFADRAAIETIVKRSAAKGYGVRTLVHEVVQSSLFTAK